MIAEELLGRLEAVRPQGTGKWQARCPAHAPDRHPSLSIREGERALLVKCWAGCTFDELTRALGLSQRDLFYDAKPGPQASRKPRTKPWRFDWRRTAARLEDHAVTLWLRAESFLVSAKGMQTPEWTDEDFDAAVKAVSRAYTVIEWSEFLEDVASDLRLYGLKKEQERYATRS